VSPGGTPRAGVLGLGLIGGSLLQGLAAAGAAPAGIDTDPDAAGAARGAGFDVLDDPAALARACDIVLVCVPPAATAAAVLELLDADPGVVVADAASVKAPVLAALGGADLTRYVPAHPLAGSERGGWDAAEPALLRDAVWAVCPPASDAPVAPLCAFAAALEPLGPRLLACSADAHDGAVARTSHVPHVVAQALARLAGDDPATAALSGGALRDMTRTVRSDPSLWLDIVTANRTATSSVLRGLLADLERLATAIDAGDEAALADAWRQGAAARATVDAIRWTEPTWEPRSLPAAWASLLELGRAGTLIRRPRLEGETLALESAAAPTP
jgi:prephenate dehydrogenase